MTKSDKNTTGQALDLEGIAALLPKQNAPPVHLWKPEFCHELDIEIARDGSWSHDGSPINRHALVKLFASVLRHDDDDRFYLVTPVEKVAIKVADAPFIAVAMTVRGTGENQVLTFRTNVDDEVLAGPENPIHVNIDPSSQEPSPYVLVRARLEALIARPVFYDLVALGVEREIDGQMMFGVWSAGAFFILGDLEGETP